MSDSDPADLTEWDGRQWTRVARRVHDRDADEELATTIVFALADAEAVAPHEVTGPSLYEHVDLEALQAVVGDGHRSRSGSGTNTVRFEYGDYVVVVESTGEVGVYEPAAEPLA